MHCMNEGLSGTKGSSGLNLLFEVVERYRVVETGVSPKGSQLP